MDYKKFLKSIIVKTTRYSVENYQIVTNSKDRPTKRYSLYKMLRHMRTGEIFEFVNVQPILEEGDKAATTTSKKKVEDSEEDTNDEEEISPEKVAFKLFRNSSRIDR